LYTELTNIRVAFQPNAWADEEFCESDNIIIRVASDIVDAGVSGEIMVGMDNHSAQRTPRMMELYASLGMLPIFTAPNCTDCISPVDHHIGRFIQNSMGKSYRDAVEQNPDIWMSATEDLDDPNCRSAEARRKLMAQWLSKAWDNLTSEFSHLIEAAFVKTGFKLALDGSDDYKMEIQGWSSPYSFR